MKTKKILSILLSVCVILAFMPQMAFADVVGQNYTYKEGTAGAGASEGPEKLIDGDTGTKWCVTNFSSAYIIFETSSAVNVSGYSITTGNDNFEYHGRNPRNWKLYGCNDESAGRNSASWIPIHSVTNDTVLKDENNKTYNFAFDKTETAYKYYMLEFTAIQSGDVMQMSEFSLTDCDHNWGTTESEAPTCMSSGYTKRTCNICKGTDTVYLKSTDHDFTGEGGKCTTCGYTADELYVDENGIPCPINGNATVITEGLTAWNNTDANSGWYIVKSNVTLNSVTVSGNVHLVLADGCNLKVNGDITEGRLTIYGQSGGTGTLDVTGRITGGYGEGRTGVGGGNITIKGGVVKAESITGGTGGDGFVVEGQPDPTFYNGSVGGDITISGGVVEAGSITGGKGGNSQGGTGGRGGNITISGGVVKAESITGGIGGIDPGDGCGGGSVAITGGVVDATSITGGNGSIGKDGSVDITGGIVFQSDDGQVYGTDVTLSKSFTISEGKTLTIGSDNNLIIPDGVILTNNGTINNNGTIANNGKIYVDGTFTGIADNLYYPLTIVDATASGDTSEHNSKNYGKAGNTISLTPYALSTGYKFCGWDVSPDSLVSIGEDNSFTMPSAALTVTAQTSRIQSSVKTDSVTTDKDGSVTVTLDRSVTTSDSKTAATVTDTVVNQILAKLASSDSKSVVIDASAGSAASTSVVISEASFRKLAEVDGIELTLVTDNGKAVLDKDTLTAVAASAGSDGQVTLNIETVEKSNNLLKVDISISTSGGYVTDFNGGKVTVTVVIDDELKGKNPVAVYIDDNGRYYKIGGKLNDDGTFTFVTGHFSTYAVMPEAEADKVIKAQEIAAVRSIKSTVTLTTKSIKRGIKVSVKIPASQKADKTGIIIYRSLKKNSGYAMYRKVKTSGSTYTITNTLNVKGNRLVQGKRYYYKARVYKVIDGKTYYGPMSSIKYIRAK